jgi:hypothetical protein
LKPSPGTANVFKHVSHTSHPFQWVATLKSIPGIANTRLKFVNKVY